MALLTKSFKVVDVDENEIEILSENFDRLLIYLRNRGTTDIYIGNKINFNINTESILMRGGEFQSWTNTLMPANAFYAKCSIGQTGKLEVEEN